MSPAVAVRPVGAEGTVTAPVTVKDAVSLTLPDVAVMVVDPAAWPEARPELLIVATLVLDEDHVTEDVIVEVLESE